MIYFHAQVSNLLHPIKLFKAKIFSFSVSFSSTSRRSYHWFRFAFDFIVKMIRQDGVMISQQVKNLKKMATEISHDKELTTNVFSIS